MHVLGGNDGVAQPAEGGGAHQCRHPAVAPRRSPFRAAGRRALVALVLLVAVSTGASGCRPPACTEPFPAAMWQEDVADTGEWPEGGSDRPVQVDPSLFAMVLVDDTPNEVILRVDGAELRFTTTNSGLPLAQTDIDRLGTSIVDGPDGAAWLVVWIVGDSGRLTSRWAWDLDSLCDGPTSPTIQSSDD